MKSILFTILVITFANNIFSQIINYNIPPKDFYKSGKLSLLEFKKYEVINLTIKNDSIYFTNKYTKAAEKFSIDEVNYLRVPEGNQAGMWALYGGLLMGVTCLSAAVYIWTDDNMIFKENAGIIAFGLIAGGVGLGALIGSGIPKWKTYYVHKDLSFLNSIKFGIYANTYGTSIQLNYTF